jgi:hypothetical protein
VGLRVAVMPQRTIDEDGEPVARRIFRKP